MADEWTKIMDDMSPSQLPEGYVLTFDWSEQSVARYDFASDCWIMPQNVIISRPEFWRSLPPGPDRKK